MQVALLNGVTMGGGAGISIPGTFRVATEKTVRDRFIVIFGLHSCLITKPQQTSIYHVRTETQGKTKNLDSLLSVANIRYLQPLKL